MCDDIKIIKVTNGIEVTIYVKNDSSDTTEEILKKAWRKINAQLIRERKGR